ncbi:MAG: hypothetical protein HQ522_21805 [Bacteroidetes bacterium]|nr:hypothetical protein [Bacteroidota bacterium]
MTYCERTDHNQYALHINKEELKEIALALTERKSKIASKLQKVISCEVVGKKKTFLKNREIELCTSCKGSGKVRANVTNTYEYDFETCPKCDGKSGIVKIITTTYEPLTTIWQEHFAQ